MSQNQSQNPYGNQGQYGGNPYAGQGQYGGNPYTDQGQYGGNPYAGQGQYGGNPYTDQGQYGGNPYAGQGQYGGNPYDNQGQYNAQYSGQYSGQYDPDNQMTKKKYEDQHPFVPQPDNRYNDTNFNNMTSSKNNPYSIEKGLLNIVCVITVFLTISMLLTAAITFTVACVSRHYTKASSDQYLRIEGTVLESDSDNTKTVIQYEYNGNEEVVTLNFFSSDLSVGDRTPLLYDVSTGKVRSIEAYQITATVCTVIWIVFAVLGAINLILASIFVRMRKNHVE